MKRCFVSLLLMIVLLLSITAEAEERFTISEIYCYCSRSLSQNCSFGLT